MSYKHKGLCVMCGEASFIIFNDNTCECYRCGLIDPESLELTDLDRLKLDFLA